MPKQRRPGFHRFRHRRIEPGTTYLLTKKCNDDLFLIRPSKIVNQILLRALEFEIRREGNCG